MRGIERQSGTFGTVNGEQHLGFTWYFLRQAVRRRSTHPWVQVPYNASFRLPVASDVMRIFASLVSSFSFQLYAPRIFPFPSGRVRVSERHIYNLIPKINHPTFFLSSTSISSPIIHARDYGSRAERHQRRPRSALVCNQQAT